MPKKQFTWFMYVPYVLFRFPFVIKKWCKGRWLTPLGLFYEKVTFSVVGHQPQSFITCVDGEPGTRNGMARPKSCNLVGARVKDVVLL